MSDQIEVDSGRDGVSVQLSFDISPPNARARILSTACRLFYQQGIRATGINAIISQSGVAKATFFRHFPSKDALIVAWLRRPESRWLDRVQAEAEARSPAGGTAARLLRSPRRADRA